MFAPEGRHAAAATGFIAAPRLAQRTAAPGDVGAAGFCRAGNRRGVDEWPRPAWARSAVDRDGRAAADIDMALRVTADALACDALGAVVLDVWGGARRVRSRCQPHADAGGATIRRHLRGVAQRGNARCEHRRNAAGSFVPRPLHRAQGGGALGRSGVRRRTRS